MDRIFQVEDKTPMAYARNSRIS